MRSKLLACLLAWLLACHIPVIHVPCESSPGRHVSSSLSSLKRGEGKDKKERKRNKNTTVPTSVHARGYANDGIVWIPHVTEGGCGCASDSTRYQPGIIHDYCICILITIYLIVQCTPSNAVIHHAPFTRPSKWWATMGGQAEENPGK